MSSANMSKESLSGAAELRAMLLVLWSGRLWIVLVTVAFAFTSLAYSLVVREVWTSRAVIDIPVTSEYFDYFTFVEEISAITEDSSKGYNEKKQKDSDKDKDKEDIGALNDATLLRAEFIKVFNSPAAKRSFLEADTVFLNHLKENGISATEAELKKILKPTGEWLNGVAVEYLDSEDKEEGLVELSFESLGPEESVDQLSRYASFSESIVRKKLIERVEARRKSLESVLELRLKAEIQRGKKFVELELARYESALNISLQASLSEPLADQLSEDYFPVKLGSKVIQAKIEELKSLKNFAVVNPKISDLENKLTMIQAVNFDKDMEFSVFSYVGEVEGPASKDKPRRVLIVAAGTLLGLVLGVIGVYFVAVFRSVLVRKPTANYDNL